MVRALAIHPARIGPVRDGADAPREPARSSAGPPSLCAANDAIMRGFDRDNMASTKKSAKNPSRAPSPDDSLPMPPWIESERLSERLTQRFAYPAYAQHETVRALVSKTTKGSVGARIDALFERCVARDLLPSAWATGGAPFCVGPCATCSRACVMDDGSIFDHKHDCPESRRPHSLEFAVSLAAEACTADPRGAVVDAEALAAEWARALAVWGARPIRGVCWTYEETLPNHFVGQVVDCRDLHGMLAFPALTAARAVRVEPFLWTYQATVTGFGKLGRVPWIKAILSSIEREAEARKKPGRPKRLFDEMEVELLSCALEGAALWHAAIAADAVVSREKNQRRSAPVPPHAALIGARFATLPNPWPALLGLLATGAVPIGIDEEGRLALNLAPWENR